MAMLGPFFFYHTHRFMRELHVSVHLYGNCLQDALYKNCFAKDFVEIVLTDLHLKRKCVNCINTLSIWYNALFNALYYAKLSTKYVDRFF